MVQKARRGCQTPRIDIYQPGDTHKAELLFELLDEYGMVLLDWQRLVLRRWLAEDEDGNFVNMTCGLSVPRQNGKTEIIVARIIYGLIFRKSQILFTAQVQDTVDIVKKRVQDFFYENEYEEIFNLLTPRFRKKPRNYGLIEFNSGAAVKFMTRTRMGGLGNTIDDLICDEAAEMMDAHQETLLSTTVAARTGNPQTIYCGTPPTAESVGTVFSRVRKEVLAGADTHAWTEWSVDALSDKEDRDIWYKTNPSLGYFLLPRAVINESKNLSVDGFNRMRLGWWSGIEDKRAIPQNVWDACYTEKPVMDDNFAPVYAVKFAPDRSEYVLAAALPLKDSDRVHVEIVISAAMGHGFARLTKWLTDRWRKCAKIIIDGATGQAILYEDLTSAGVLPRKIVQPNMKEIGAAHQFMYDAITRGELSHYNQPKLNQVVRVTKQRPLGRYGGFGWESMSKEISTTALDAATFALWGQRVFKGKRATVADAERNNEKWRQILSNI